MRFHEVLVTDNIFWKNKILKRLQNVYKKTKYFEIIYPKIENWLLKDYKNLAELNINGIKLICEILNINNEFLLSSDFSNETKCNSARSKRITELLDWANADEYLCAFGSFDYMKEDKYDYKKYPVIFQNYNPKPYTQIHSSDFIP